MCCGLTSESHFGFCFDFAGEGLERSPWLQKGMKKARGAKTKNKKQKTSQTRMKFEHQALKSQRLTPKKSTKENPSHNKGKRNKNE